jgi:mRNA interferase HicA
MPKLPVLTSKKLLKIFLQEGFAVDRITGSHYILFNETSRKRISIPYHIKDLPKGTLHTIIKFSGVDLKRFR